MQIAGFEKLSLVDYPSSACAVIFCPSCTFRCPFCHNANIAFAISPTQFALQSEAEVFRYLTERRKLLDGVCISGGEPTLQKDLRDFILKLKNMDYKVKLDTNGNSPDVLSSLIDEKIIDYVAMDIKSSWADYPRAVGISGFDVANVQKSVQILKKNLVDYEFRTTLAKPIHSQSIIRTMAEMLSGAKRWRLQRYVYSDNVPDSSLGDFSSQEIHAALDGVLNKPDDIIYY